MVWAGISWKGKTKLVVVNSNLNADDYAHLFENYCLPFNEEVYGGNAILQQDNAPTHSAKHTRDFFCYRRNYRSGGIRTVYPTDIRETRPTDSDTDEFF